MSVLPVSSARRISGVPGAVPAFKPRVDVSIWPELSRNCSSMRSALSKLAAYRVAL
jgi:hypothetical protein